MEKPKNRKEYVQWYYDLHLGDIEPSGETDVVGRFLAKNVFGKVLDCGCGPVPQIWSICMPKAKEIHAIDVFKESIYFVNKKLKNKQKWYNNLIDYQKIVESVSGKLPKVYILKQVNKLKSVKKADMTKKIPFKDHYFDTAISLYSLGVLKDETALDSALKEISRVLKKGGKLLHINTNGRNSNNILPEYTWKGLSQTTKLLESKLKRLGFIKIKIKETNVESEGTYRYDKIHLLSAVKK